ncbi:hypothetical protein EHQ24_08905 [Leptospira noumeaensis]|uniref:SbsA Ig-like domain-containing protein n=1 Tax=Leptospira noumeaensis TaxID=2484964 RepID=A0A4R9I5R5_9LEPT|nr:Ig-like domain-containing protein [Leptospira noumeaensis]TGK81428.1 hypothetical protein EHQ24_08905 [Leptospira noumeaensis]
MNLRFLQLPFFPFHQLTKGICILLVPFLMFQNCYFNPVVNGILNPKVEESDSSALLGLAGGLGGSASTVSITGQIKKLGVSLVGVDVSLGTPLFSSKNTISSTTNTAGRFYLDIPTGSATLQFSDGGTLVTIQLMVTPIGATVGFINNSSYSVQNLDVYVLGSEPPVYLELLSSMPFDGAVINSSNYYDFVPDGRFLFTFSEEVDYEASSSASFIINPSLDELTIDFSKENVYILPSFSLSPNQFYTITLNSGIKSLTGKSNRPTTIQFMTGDLFL